MRPAVLVPLIILGGLAVFGGFIWAIFSFVFALTAPLVEAADRWDAAIAASDSAAAHAEFSNALQRQLPEADMQEMLMGLGIWGQDGEFSFSSQSINGGEGQLQGTWTGPDGTVIPVRLGLVRENDVWRIIAFRFGSDT